jgi:hypothetical protein
VVLDRPDGTGVMEARLVGCALGWCADRLSELHGCCMRPQARIEVAGLVRMPPWVRMREW